MSRGLGRIERCILKSIERGKTDPHGPLPVLITSWHVVGDAYRPIGIWGHWKPTRAQRKATVHAMHSFVRKFPEFALTGGKGRKQMFLYEIADPLSVNWAKG